mmetsp:Transcript_12109/g.18561  ORF Transcript_12109/g.18561 Transcript_12109/m.18561 type:complete len:111 (-) Transcript_12109:336-668(-)
MPRGPCGSSRSSIRVRLATRTDIESPVCSSPAAEEGLEEAVVVVVVVVLGGNGDEEEEEGEEEAEEEAAVAEARTMVECRLNCSMTTELGDLTGFLAPGVCNGPSQSFNP